MDEALPLTESSLFCLKLAIMLIICSTCSYTGLSLSYTSDILPAFGGLARQMSTVRSGRYIAGLWTDSMVDDLLWMGSAAKVRPAWRAPYWSWASVVAPIYYSDGPIFWNPDEAEEERPSFEHIAEILGCSAKPKFQDGFGEVVSGELRLRSRWAKATLQYWGPNDTGVSLAAETRPKERSMIYAVQFSETYACQIVPDYAIEKSSNDFVPNSTEVFCIPMSIQSVNLTQQSPRKLYVLVLVQTDSDEETYERIALLVVDERRGLSITGTLEHFSKEVKYFTLV